MARDPGKYFFSVFGTPSTKETWGWRVEGHHVSLHFDVVNGTLVSSTPTFFGSNPAEVPDGPKKGTRILAAEEDSARALLMALDAKQREKAVINTVALERDRDDEQARHHAAVAGRHPRRRDDRERSAIC